jgi:hypothetical protein
MLVCGVGGLGALIQNFNAKLLPNYFIFTSTKQTKVTCIHASLENIILQICYNIFSKLCNSSFVLVYD